MPCPFAGDGPACRDSDRAASRTAGFFAQAEAENALARTPRIGHGKFQLLLVRGAFLYGMPGEALRCIREHNWLRLVDPAWEGVHATSDP